MSNYLEIWLPLPLWRSFDYRLPEGIIPPKPGARVRVPFGKREKVGFVKRVIEKSHFDETKIKSILEVIDTEPLFDTAHFEFLQRAATYYHHPMGDVLASALPKALRLGKTLPEYEPNIIAFKEAEHLTLSQEQQIAFDEIIKQLHQYQTFLIKGATGSGKTEIYLQVIDAILKQNKQALVLVPEIALTPQTIARFEARFGGLVGTYHSGLTDKARLNTWLKTKSGECQVLVGTRSSLFLPFKSLRILIVDEEHDPSFKQQTGFRYSARDLAIYRAHQLNCPVILGSATPSFESLHNVTLGKYQCLTLKERVNAASFPSVEIMDVRHKQLVGGFAPPLISKIRTHLENKKQVLIFLNRRGYAPTWMCFECQWQATCQRCNARLTYHLVEHYLRCPHCDKFSNVPAICPSCHHTTLHPVGAGTQRLEETVLEHFPDFPITRLDSDTTRGKDKLATKLDMILSGQPQIILGTQMLAKGHHFPDVTLAVIMDADSGLFSSDFRGAERMGQLITQVSGRAGRGTTASEVVIQTYHPDHPLMLKLVREGYDVFSQELLTERSLCHLPPFSHLALFRAEGPDPKYPERYLAEIKNLLMPHVKKLGCTLYGPLPAPMPKRQNRYRFQLLLMTSIRTHLHQLLNNLLPETDKIKEAKRIRWSLDVDPIDIL